MSWLAARTRQSSVDPKDWMAGESLLAGLLHRPHSKFEASNIFLQITSKVVLASAKNLLYHVEYLHERSLWFQ
jgi:hypothetical protein